MTTRGTNPRRLPNGRWQARFQPGRGGKQRQATFDTKAEALDWLADQRATFKKGTYLDPRDQRTLVRDVITSWRTTTLHRPNTTKTVNTAVGHINKSMGDMTIGSVRPSDIQTFVNHLTRNYKPGTAAAYYGWLTEVMGYAVANGYRGTDPTYGIKVSTKGAPEEEELVALDQDQVESIWSHMPTHLRLGVLIGATLGLRVSEVLGLTLETSIPFPHRSVNVTQQLYYEKGRSLHLRPVKSGAATLETPGVLVDALADHLAHHPPVEVKVEVFYEKPDRWVTETRRFVLHGPGGQPVTHGEMGDAFKTAVIKAGLDPKTVTFHALRHHLASVLIRDHVEPQEVQRAMRHAKLSTTLDVYTGWFQNAGVKASDAVDRVWRGRSWACRENVMT